MPIISGLVFLFSVMACIFSTLAFIISVTVYIQYKAAELSTHDYVQMTPEDMFESDVNKINGQLKDDELNEEIDNVMEPNKKFNEVIL